MTVIVGVSLEHCNFIFSDTALSFHDSIELNAVSKIGRLNKEIAYGISGDVKSA
jgi:20S proteasome alpha/beta subunit